jgi:hypothetical protein
MKKFGILLIVLSGCVSSIEPDPGSLGLNYYPLQVGSYQIFHINSKIFNLDGSVDTVTYLMKEVVVDSFPGSDQDSYTYVINRYKKGINEPEWVIEEVVSARINFKTMVLTENSTAYVKLVFPMQEDLGWDGNSLNDLEPETYRIRMLSQPFTVDSVTFANTVHVFQADLLDPAQISQDDYRFEVFADDVGLVYKQKIVKEYCDYLSSGICSEPTVLSGLEYEQKLMEFGKE